MVKKIEALFTSEKASYRGPLLRTVAVIMVIVISTLFNGAAPSAKNAQLTSVTIVDGSKCFEVETKGSTVGEALLLAGIKLGESDVISKGNEETISDGDTIFINRSKTIYLENSGKTFKIPTTENTVGDALVSDGFEVGKYDEVIPDVNTPVEDGMTVSVTRVYVEIYDVKEKIPFTERTIENPEKNVGYERVLQEGKAGVYTKTFKKVSKDGAGITATLIGAGVEEAPVERIVEVGTKKVYRENSIGAFVLENENASLTEGFTSDGVPFHAMPAMAQNNSKTTISGNTAYTASGIFKFKKVLNCRASAYEGSAVSNGKWAGTTATGRAPVYGIVAVDPRVIPLNSKLYIESADGGKSWVYGFAIAGDTGGAIKGDRIDLCYQTVAQCYSFGRRNAVVYVLE